MVDNVKFIVYDIDTIKRRRLYIMKFSKFYQPKNRKGGRKPSLAAIEKKQSAERERQIKAFNDFKNAESGNFNGFDFVNIFHEQIKKSDAIYTGESDESAEVATPFGTYHAGADNVTAYFFNRQPQKIVRFNSSVYFF